MEIAKPAGFNSPQLFRYLFRTPFHVRQQDLQIRLFFSQIPKQSGHYLQALPDNGRQQVFIGGVLGAAAGK